MTEPAGAGTLDAAGYLACLVECVDELADGRAAATGSAWSPSPRSGTRCSPLDAAGAPLGPVLTWLDTRAVAAAGVVRAGRPGGLPPAYRHLVAPLLLVDAPALAARLPAGTRRPLHRPRRVRPRRAARRPAPMSVSQASGHRPARPGRRQLGRRRRCELAGVPAGAVAARSPPPTGAAGCAPSTPAAGRSWPALPGRRPVGDGAAANVAAGLRRRRSGPLSPSAPRPRCVSPSTRRSAPPCRPCPTGSGVTASTTTTSSPAPPTPAGGTSSPGPSGSCGCLTGDELEAALAGYLGAVPGRRPPLRRGPAARDRARPAPAACSGLGFHTTAVDIFAGLMPEGSAGQVADELDHFRGGCRRADGGGARRRRDRRLALVALGLRRRARSPHASTSSRNPEIGAIGAALVALGRIACAAPAVRARTDRDLRLVGHDSPGTSQYPS